MKRQWLILSFLFFYQLALGQRVEPAFVEQQINLASSDIARLDSIEKYAPRLYLYGHFDIAFDYYQKGLEIAEENQTTSKYSFLKLNLARCYNRKNQNKKAINLGLEALRDLDSTSTIDFVLVSNIISHFYTGTNKLDSALYYNYLADSVDILTNSNIRYKTIAARSLIYNKQGLTQLGIDTAEEAYELAKVQGNESAVLWTLHNIRELTAYTQYAEKYGQYSREYLELISKKDPSQIFHKGTFELAGKDILEQIAILEKVTDYYSTNYYKHGYSQSLEKLTELYLENKQFEDAYGAIVRHEPLIINEHYANALYEFYTRKYEAEKALGLFFDATITADQMMRLRDSSLNKEVLRQNLELKEKYETAAKDQEIQLLSKDKQLSDLKIKRSNFTKWLLTLGLFALLFFSLYLYRNIQQKKQTNLQLADQKQIIERNLLEKETLLKEIHHRVKNNLQIISSLLRLQSRSIEDPSTKEALLEGQNRVQSMALIHQNLYKEQNLTGVEVKKYFENLCQNLLSTYKVSKDDFQLILDIEPLELDVSTIIPIGLIVNELFTNSLKYAFKATKSPVIGARMEEKNGILILETYDNGSGIPDNLKEYLSNNEGRRRDTHWGFGTRLLQTFAQKLDAKITASNEHGTTIKLEIKNYQIVK